MRIIAIIVLLIGCIGISAFWKRDKNQAKQKQESETIEVTADSNTVPSIDNLITLDQQFTPGKFNLLRDAAFPLSSGFISGDIIGAGASIPFMFKISSRVDKPSYPCRSVEFVNLPDPNPSPFVAGNKFNLMKELYNGKFAWTNGREFLSFIAGDDHGTWIVGNKPGVDSGYVFIKPSGESLTPVSSTGTGSGWSTSWHWLDAGRKWTPFESAALICREDILSLAVSNQNRAQYYYNMEYFDTETKESFNSYFIPGMFSVGEVIPPAETEGLFYDMKRNIWRPLKDLKIVASMGEPSVIRDSTGAIGLGHLVNEEHGPTGWRLTFRYAKGFNKNRNEVSIIYDRFGIQTVGYELASLSLSQLEVYNSNLMQSLSKVSRGDYLWLWFSLDSKNSTLADVKDISPGESVEKSDEILLECIQVSEERAVFQYHVSERYKTMRQSVLDMDTKFIVMSKSKTNPSTVEFTMASVPLKIQGGFHLGSDIISFIRQYLSEKEGAVGKMSSCYMYHAAVSLPKPLVYAAEFICVLIGSKPVTLIQYVTPSDHQWKFPYVSRLTKRLTSAMLLHPGLFEVNMTVTTLEKDKTLVLYRPSRQYLVDALLPIGQAQALHPGPYIDPNNKLKSNQEQIYNAYWNGYVLGYPKYFIESYCLGFHNDLTTEEKEVQVKLAKADVEEYFRSNGLQPVQIMADLDKPVDDKIWSYL